MSDAPARRELLARMRDVLMAIRLFKNMPPPRHLAVPSGTLGVLATIDDIGVTSGCHVKDLAQRCRLDPSTVSRAVAALVGAGLVARSADPADGRASVLALTDRGRAVLASCTAWYGDLLAEALQDWSNEDLAAFGAMLQRFSDDLIRSAGRRTPTLEAAQ
jgi:DNA-binding MarR family transcriptional regulator